MKKCFAFWVAGILLSYSSAFCENRPLLISGMLNYPPVMWEEGGGYAGIAEELDQLVREKYIDYLFTKYINLYQDTHPHANIEAQ
ncbi:MAG: hypothetical protein MUE70_03395 [Desulfobacterales bacterium]|jgi:hypothetical protein|nr:hypothetical protein [Desulfobacterales bacterium]